MEKHVFISKAGKGWFKLEIPCKLVNSSFEELCNWTFSMVKRYNYKGFLISDNSHPYPIRK